jgi:uncharacterized repeat protein (TIGR03803 family)
MTPSPNSRTKANRKYVNAIKNENPMRMQLLWLATWIMAMTAAQLTAQTFTVVHSFATVSNAPPGPYYNSDGAYPITGVILSGNNLYGTAEDGGSSGNGTVFSINTDGTGFTTLHTFTETDTSNGTNLDGASPTDSLVLSGNTLYGTAAYGGGTASGTVFAVNTDGTGFAIVHTFTVANPPFYTNSDGWYPYAGLVLSTNTLYGTAFGGGSSGYGTVFAVNTDGTGFRTLYSFTAPVGTAGVGGNGTNSDGGYPYNALVLSGNTLYGTAQEAGGSAGNGTVFAVNTDGTGFRTLHSFTATTGASGDSGNGTNSDGADPGGLILSGNTLYGTAPFGGTSGNGTLFVINTNGSSFTTLYNFSAGSGSFPFVTNSDGAEPHQGLISSGNTLYGMAQFGGTVGRGTLFAINTDGSGFTNLHNFAATLAGRNKAGGEEPLAGLMLSGNTLYGTTADGGNFSAGTVFSISFPPQLTIKSSNATVTLTWSTNNAGFDYTGYTLQSTTNILPAAWNTVSPAPVVVHGQNTVSNLMSGTCQFYRLSQH